jgi:hypothetical protein
MAEDAVWNCKLVSTGSEKELIVFFSWREQSFDIMVVDEDQRLWAQQGPPPPLSGPLL